MRAQMQRSRLTPWIGLVVPPIAWAVHHQVGSDAVFYDCRVAATGFITAAGAVLALITLASAAISWASRPSRGFKEMRTFVAYLGAMSGAVFFLALAFQTLATLLLPACHP